MDIFAGRLQRFVKFMQQSQHVPIAPAIPLLL
jgi:hypothetical protein